MTTHRQSLSYRINIDDIFNTTPSEPNIDEQQQPRIFRPGMLISSDVYQRILNEVVNRDKTLIKHHDHSSDEQQSIGNILNQYRQEELEHLNKIILSEQPKNDTTVQFILNQLNLPSNPPHNTTVATSSPSSMTIHTAQQQQHSSHVPLIQSGVTDHHHRPYGHLDRTTIAQECQFNLQRPTTTTTTETHKQKRLNAKSFAITSWATADVSKEVVLDHIKKEFGIDNIQYICVSEELSELNHQRHFHIQIILKEKVNRRKPFLDDITGTRCNYQVTRNDLAWNEYIKKENNYIEFNEFKSTRTRGEKQWPSSSTTSTPITSNTSDQPDRQLVPMSRQRRSSSTTSTSTTTTVRAQMEARRQYEHETVVKALELAEINVHQAMDLIRYALPTKFLAHSTWYLSTFNYVHLRAQEQADRTGAQIDKEYVWPLSFPQCTDQLRQSMDRWIRHHFSRTKRAKCLILIGPTGTGKTSFALSLPGRRVNYFKERWNLDHWSDYARYSVYDDIPWDDFSKLNYPNKKSLLTQNGKINATDKYRTTKQINVQQPAIVLLNPEDAGSLLAEPLTTQEQQTAMYWKQRAFIYVMQEGEYFFKPSSKSHHHQAAATTTEQQQHLSGSSSMGTNDARLGELDEFDQMIDRYQQKHRQTS